MDTLDHFFRAMAYMIGQPIVAAIPLLVFAGLYRWLKNRAALIATILWALYLPYELGMKFRILCTGECNIRIDLLVIYPALALASVLALVMAITTLLKNR